MQDHEFKFLVTFMVNSVSFSEPVKTTLAGTDCPFPKGTYGLTYSEKKGVENQCSDDAASTATVDGSTITMNACAGSDNYGMVDLSRHVLGNTLV